MSGGLIDAVQFLHECRGHEPDYRVYFAADGTRGHVPVMAPSQDRAEQKVSEALEAGRVTHSEPFRRGEIEVVADA